MQDFVSLIATTEEVESISWPIRWMTSCNHEHREVMMSALIEELKIGKCFDHIVYIYVH